MGYNIKADDRGRMFVSIDRYDGEPLEWVQMNDKQMKELRDARKRLWRLEARARELTRKASEQERSVESIVVRIVKGTP